MTKPVMNPVTSSNISAVGHDGKDLYIDFVDGGSYKFNDVPEDIYSALRAAGSVGKYFHAQIKGVFTSENIGGGAEPSIPAGQDGAAGVPPATGGVGVQEPQADTGAGVQGFSAPAPVIDNAGNPHPMTAGEGTDGQSTAKEQPESDPTAGQSSGPSLNDGAASQEPQSSAA